MSREPDKFARLTANIAFPEGMSEIDKALKENEQERQDLLRLREMALDLRKMAERRRGEAPSDEALRDEAPEPQADPAALTFAVLINRYQTDEISPFRDLRYKTRETYESNLRRLDRDIGNEKVAAFDEARLWGAFETWSGGGHLALARSLISTIRILATYGSKHLNSRDCRELKLTLHDMRFERPTPKNNEKITIDQARAIIERAHELGVPSIALVQAFQVDCGLKQKDVIGEWVPLNEPIDSQIIDMDEKWVRGLIWSEIDSNLVLRHVTSATGELIERRLSEAPLVMAEFQKMGVHVWQRGEGPVILRDGRDVPWQAYDFRRWWRKVADAAGVPKSVKNMDSA